MISNDIYVINVIMSWTMIKKFMLIKALITIFEVHFIQRILKVMFAKLSTFVTFIAFSNALSLRLAAPEVTSCLEGTENYVENISVNIQPWPVHVATGATLSIDGGLTILDAIVEGSQLKLDLSLVTALGNLPIPCLPVSF